MAKPKGGTLTRLFEVSERERQEFYENIQKKIRVTTPDPGAPVTGPPETGIPFSGALVTGIDGSQAYEIYNEPSTIQQYPTSAIPSAGALRLDIPNLGTPESGIPETDKAGIPDSGVPVIEVPFKHPPPIPRPANVKIRRAAQVQDAHSLGEQLVLTTLWNGASPVEGKSYRRIVIGYRTLSGMCGLTVNNCKANLKSLLAKLAIEPEAGYSNTVATTYRVYSFAEILRRREAAGLTHVIRSKGARFVHPVTGIPLTGTPTMPDSGVPDATRGIPEADKRGIPAPGTDLRNKKEQDSKERLASAVGVVSTTIRKFIVIDDDAVRQIVQNCLQQDPDATVDEIAHFTELKLHQHRKNRSVQNLPGLLIRSVQDYFRSGSGELADYRAEKAKEVARGRDLAKHILNSPVSTDEERQYAMNILNS